MQFLNDNDPKQAADEVMRGLIRVTSQRAKGAHDADFVCVDDYAYVVEMNNDVAPGHGTGEHQYCVLSIIHLPRLEVVEQIPLARSEEQIGSVRLPRGACFVPRIIRRSDNVLRCFFASEPFNATTRVDQDSQIWYRDFRMDSGTFEDHIHKARLKTTAGIFDMQPKPFHDDAALHGFTRKAELMGLYLIDSFKNFEGKTYAVINNYRGRQNALAMLHDDFETFKIIGHYNEPQSAQMSESAVWRFPDGHWEAICRSEIGNYLFVESADGRQWTSGEELPHVKNGGISKPTFDCFHGVYYLGWQDKARVADCGRSIFNIDVSEDGRHWQRKYRFESAFSFQYPTFKEHNGVIWLSVTQSDHNGSSDRIMFGRLECC